MQLPSFSSYVDYSSDNYGAHALRFDTDNATFWFSYKTLVAFHRLGHGAKVVHQNDWGPTTGKHLNAIDGGDKKARLSATAFKARFAEVFGD